LGRDSGCCKGANLPRSTFFEHTCASIERRARCAHVVNKDNDTTKNQLKILAGRKGALHIAVASAGREVGLRRSTTNTPERGGDRQTDMACQIFRLVESAFTPS
jgi:hypothetical protein